MAATDAPAQALLNPENGSFELARFGLYGLAVMGQNFALNVASRGIRISVSNRSNAKIDACVTRANAAVKADGSPDDCSTLMGFYEMQDFINSIAKPRCIMLLVKAGRPVEAVLGQLLEQLEPGDMIIDGGNEWYVNSEERIARAHAKNLFYLAMGVSGGEKGARYGPSLMPGGDKEVYDQVQDILMAVAAIPAKTDFVIEDEEKFDFSPCVTYLGPQGFGNYVKMVHNGIEYGDMQLIAEAYDLLSIMCGFGNEQLAETFDVWNNDPDLKSFLIDITAQIFRKKDDVGTAEAAQRFLVDQVVDSTGSKGTGKWTVQELAEQGISGPTISAALNMRYMSAVRDERAAAQGILGGGDVQPLPADKVGGFVEAVRQAVYASKICSYAQGMNLIKEFGKKKVEESNGEAVLASLGEAAKIWRAGCIIRANFLNDITDAYDANPDLASLLVSDKFSGKLLDCQAGWREVVQVAVGNGIPVPAISGSLAYFDAYRRARLPANLTQAQRDFFGAHRYVRLEDWAAYQENAALPKDQQRDLTVHSEWANPEEVRTDPPPQ